MVGKLKEGSAAQRTIAELGLSDVVEFVSGVSDQRIVELYNESACAVVPVAVRGLLAPGHRGHEHRLPAGGHHRRRTSRGRRPDGETCYAVAPATAVDLARGILAVLDDPHAAELIGKAGRERVDPPLELAPHRRADRRALPGDCSRPPSAEQEAKARRC